MNAHERERRAVQLAWLTRVERERELRREARRDVAGCVALAVVWAVVAWLLLAW